MSSIVRSLRRKSKYQKQYDAVDAGSYFKYNLVDLNTIYSRVKQGEEAAKLREAEEENEFFKHGPFIPEYTLDYTTPQFKAPKLTKKNIPQISRAYSLVDSFKFIRKKDACTIMPIPSTRNKYITICGSDKNVRNVVKLMLRFGVISVEDNSYRFHQKKKKNNRSKIYRYYPENEKLFIEFCKANEIDKIKEEKKDTFIQDFFDADLVRFGSRQHLLRPSNVSKEAFKEYIKDILYTNYPYLQYYQDLAEYINDNHYKNSDPFKISYEPNIEYAKGDKYIRKIGIRATNCLANSKKTRSKEDKPNILYRSEILKQYNLHLSYDVSSSVPRVAMSINKGRWISEYEVSDIYLLIYKEYKRLRGKFITSNSGTIADYNKEAVKRLFMWVYFDPDSIKSVANHIQNAMINRLDQAAVYRELLFFKKAIDNTLGVSFGSEIFYHESNIYMEVTEQLLEEGFFTWQVYDAWYASKPGVQQFEFGKKVQDIVAEKANLYISQMWK